MFEYIFDIFPDVLTAVYMRTYLRVFMLAVYTWSTAQHGGIPCMPVHIACALQRVTDNSITHEHTFSSLVHLMHDMSARYATPPGCIGTSVI